MTPALDAAQFGRQPTGSEECVAKATTGGNAGRLGVGLASGTLIGLLALDLDLPSIVSFWGDRTLVVPAAAVLGALLWLTPLRRLVAVAAVGLALLWLAAAGTPLVSWMADGLVRRDPLQSAEAVFVFGSMLQTDGDPTTDAMSRLLKGVELVAEGRAKRLVVSELPPPSRHYAPIAREWTNRLAPGSEVLAVGPVHNTHDEAAAVARLSRERGWRRVLAVTSPVHSLRAAASLEKAGLQVVSVPALETRYDVEVFDRPDDRRRAFGSVAHERVGMLVYRRRGWI
jgi:uncharacterized SAM-binding protein YcdF (DUF218 family)